MIRDSSLSIVTSDGLNDRGSFPRRRMDFAFAGSVQRIPGTRSANIKCSKFKADHSLPLNLEVKNAWSFTSIPPIALVILIDVFIICRHARP
jgi:hypothetical protein